VALDESRAVARAQTQDIVAIDGNVAVVDAAFAFAKVTVPGPLTLLR